MIYIAEPEVDKDYHSYNYTLISGLAKLEQATTDDYYGFKLLLQAMKA